MTNKHFNKSTKIVATISDRRCDQDFLKQVFDAGVNVVRLNSAHMSHEGFERVIGNVRAVSDSVAIMMDTKGPEVRTTATASGETIRLLEGEEVRIIADPDAPCTGELISVNYPGFVRDVPVGASVLFDDGLLGLKVLRKDDTTLYCRVLNDGVVGSHKSVNVPNVRIDLPAVTERDRDTILFSMSHDVDFIAHSFVRSSKDVAEVQKILDSGGSDIKIISKIENQEGVDNIDEIIRASYGIMVARGDLGIEVDFENIPTIQRTIIHMCIDRKKPVIVATQMLHTMMENPRPTRAEVSDVSGAIMMNTDAVMLSGETAAGKYPVEAVRTMTRIIRAAEELPPMHATTDLACTVDHSTEIRDYLSKCAVESLACFPEVTAIISDAYSGQTARTLASYRGNRPILALCSHQSVARQLALSYGVYAFYLAKDKAHGEDNRHYLLRGIRHLLDLGTLTEDQSIVYCGGTLKPHNGTNTLEIFRLKNFIDFHAEELGE